MKIERAKSIIESIMFSAGRPVETKEFMSSLEMSFEDIENIIEDMRNEYKEEKRGIEIVKTNNAYQLCTKKENYDYIYPIFDKRSKPNLSQAALEVLAIIAYNPKITRAEIEAIRVGNSDGTIYKLLEYELIQDVGKLDAPRKANNIFNYK